MAHTARKILTTLAAAVAITAVTPAAVEAYDANISETVVTASVEGPVVVSSDCVGGQDEIDTCVGATYYAPVADYLGVPYYAQHNGKGGEAWLSLEVGDEVIVDGVSYTVDITSQQSFTIYLFTIYFIILSTLPPLLTPCSLLLK